MQDLQVTRELLSQLLSKSGPEKGARLKQRLLVAFSERGLGRFDEKNFGYLKFKYFLEKEFADILAIEKGLDGGDIVVSLKNSGLRQVAIRMKPPVIRNDIWQAFSNPDENRRRFFNKADGAVVHFRRGDNAQLEASVTASPDCVEILLIPGSKQLAWMKEFLDSLQLPDDQRAALGAIPKEPYSSGLNLTFTRALGDLGDGWKKFRRDQIFNEIQRWAQKSDIAVEKLLFSTRNQVPSESGGLQLRIPSNARQKAVHLLDVLSEEDIELIVLPTLVTAILSRSRR